MNEWNWDRWESMTRKERIVIVILHTVAWAPVLYFVYLAF